MPEAINTLNKKSYISPEITRIVLDYSVSLLMGSQPTDPPPRTDSDGNKSEPFASPFGDKPFG